jgi:hypothetical protein
MEFKSSFLALMANGKFSDILTPWVLKIDLDNQTLYIIKRKWYYFGKDVFIHPFKFVRSIHVEELMIGANVRIKSLGNLSIVNYLSKNDVKTISTLLIDLNQKYNLGIVLN